MKNKISRFLFLIVFLSCGCQEKTKPLQLGPLNNTHLYFESEIKALKQSNRSLTKNLIHKGTRESIHIAKPDWEKELVPFIETISSQPAQVQAFQIDTVAEGTSKVVHFTSLDASATIKNMTTYYTAATPDSVIIIKQVSNSYYNSSDTLKYFGNGNYKITAENLPGFGKKLGFVLEGISGTAE